MFSCLDARRVFVVVMGEADDEESSQRVGDGAVEKRNCWYGGSSGE